MTVIVRTKIEAAGGEALHRIMLRKEAERRQGHGLFWWGIGTSLGVNAAIEAEGNGGVLPVLFTKMPSQAQRKDADPDEPVCIWTKWRVRGGSEEAIPRHVLVTGGRDPQKPYYALTCHSDTPLAIAAGEPFDPEQYRTIGGKRLPTRGTFILRGLSEGTHAGEPNIGFSSSLVKPWCVRLVSGRLMKRDELRRLDAFVGGGDWQGLVDGLRAESG